MAELVLNDINKYYQQQHVVKALNLTIKSGDFVALLGPSGCGKTTTLRMLAGFEQPDQGRIHLGERCLFNDEKQLFVPPEKRRMGMVFQSYALWPHMSVADNVGYPLKLQGINGTDYQTKVNEVLELVHLADKAQCSPQQLSGGQRQRVALARCLIADPEVILLDEPLSNLDQHLRESMQTVFKQFHQRTKATFIYVTHDQGEAMALADHIAVLNKGNLEQWGTPEQLYQKPQSQWLAEFIGNGMILHVNHDFAGQTLSHEQIHNLILLQCWGKYPILVRPQHIQLDAMSGIRVTITDCIYRGERYEIIMTLDSNQKLMMYHHCKLTIGDHAFINITEAWGMKK